MKRVKEIAVLLLALCLLLTLSACGDRGPKAADAENYVKAVLDMMCTGDYDHSVKLTDVDELAAAADAGIDRIMDPMLQKMNLNDDVAGEFRELLTGMFSKARYTVGKAEEVAGGFSVPVTIEPFAFSGMNAAVTAGSVQLLSDPDASGMTEEEIANRLTAFVIDALKAELEDPRFGKPVEVTVRYKELQEGVFGIDEADSNKLIASMFRNF